MKRNIDEILKHALSPTEEPDTRLNQKILYQAEEMTHMAKLKKNRIPAAILAASITLIIGSTAVFAAWKYLNSSQVAKELYDDKLAEAFQGEDAVAVNETQEYGGYKITLLGAVAGKNISEHLATNNQGQLQDNRFYAAVAIERSDGTPMPSTSDDAYGDDPFFVSPYVKGLDPNFYSIMSMGGGYSEFVENGIQYRLLDMENIEIFADRGIYIGVNSGTFYDIDAYLFDESTGEISRNESYNGVNALFVLPLDPAKADPEAAKAFLDKVDNPEDTEMPEQTEADIDVDEFVSQLTTENLEDYAEVIESTVQTLKPNAKGEFSYEWELPSGKGGSGTAVLDDLFPDHKAGCVIGGYSYSEDGLEGLTIDTFTLNDDGTVTYAIYKPKASKQ